MKSPPSPHDTKLCTLTTLWLTNLSPTKISSDEAGQNTNMAVMHILQAANTQCINALETPCVNQLELNHPLKTCYTRRFPTASSPFLHSFSGSNDVLSAKSNSWD